MNKIFNKIIAVVNLITILFFQSSGFALAYFQDEESSQGFLSSGLLDFEISSLSDFSPAMSPATSSQTSFSINDNGTLPFKYWISLSTSTGSLCASTTISLKQGETELYKGLLLSMPEITIGNYNANNKDFSIKSEMSADSLGIMQNQNCAFELKIQAVQTNHDKGQGYRDSALLSKTINTGFWIEAPKPKAKDFVVLNEFLPNPTGIAYGHNWGQDSNSKPKGEWVELYNKHETESFDIKDWTIRDRDNHTVLISSITSKNDSTIIPPKGFLVIFMNMSLLNNSGSEDIKLYDDFATLVDMYTYNGGDYCYLEPTMNETNDEEPIMPICAIFPTVPDNKSIARIPDGIGAWVDPIPTPGEQNIPDEQLNPITTPTSTNPITTTTLPIMPIVGGGIVIPTSTATSTTSTLPEIVIVPAPTSTEPVVTTTDPIIISTSTDPIIVLETPTSTEPIQEIPNSSDIIITGSTIIPEGTIIPQVSSEQDPLPDNSGSDNQVITISV